MPDVKDVLAKLKQTNAGSNIAGYVANGVLKYEVSSNDALPAAVYLFDQWDAFQSPNIYTTLPDTHWLFTYTKPSRRNSTGLISVGTRATGVTVGETPVRDNTREIRMLAGQGSDGPFAPSGGLYDAAKKLTSGRGIFYKGVEAHTTERGMHRALRYYMLAAYAVLGRCAKANYSEGNYVCAMAVSDTGKILSWGVNSKSFHHGEVNMLLNYFGENAGSKQLPSKTIVFSTLTPCEQCSNYLQSVRPAESLILMGQQDTGDFGKAGEAHGKYLRDYTDPVRNRVETTKNVPVQQGYKWVRDRNDRRYEVEVPRYVNKKITQVNRYNLDQDLMSRVTDGNIATKIGYKCRLQLSQSFDTLTRKFEKERGEDLEDQNVKKAVLCYLQKWIDTVSTEVKVKKMA